MNITSQLITSIETEETNWYSERGTDDSTKILIIINEMIARHLFAEDESETNIQCLPNGIFIFRGIELFRSYDIVGWRVIVY